MLMPNTSTFSPTINFWENTSQQQQQLPYNNITTINNSSSTNYLNCYSSQTFFGTNSLNYLTFSTSNFNNNFSFNYQEPSPNQQFFNSSSSTINCNNNNFQNNSTQFNNNNLYSSYLSPLEFCNDLIDYSNEIKLNYIKPTLPLIENNNLLSTQLFQNNTSSTFLQNSNKIDEKINLKERITLNKKHAREKTKQKGQKKNKEITTTKTTLHELPKQRRQRTHFSTQQLNELETLFSKNKYPDVSNRATISRCIGLAEQCIRFFYSY
ncbi:Homeobox domain-containing protein [Meloidogyne graminicola]|uniref:Homeobox domain-containing protein n=1 Tax=Meloidogyne graminicola TaxID=189291 RepID=A0A8S9ZW34_9BILA|nr:Homeobox domain-containing protein [Meloidogyne graminicola]